MGKIDMEKISKHMMNGLFLMVMFFFISCKKDESTDYSYKEKFYGNYNFKVITQGRDQYLMTTYDTSYFLGNVRKYEVKDESKSILYKDLIREVRDKISIEILENRIVPVHVAEDGALYADGVKIGSVSPSSISLNFHTGGNTYGIYWIISGERQ